ncbi:polysaccharide biosynthesis/export family protein [Telmatospirillum siberiense]|nr:polysaccharide biosynthesis/export family protein [Telmatospirillum siberiense]
MLSGLYASVRRFSLLLLVVVIASLLLGGQSMADDKVAYRLGTGDKVRVTVFNEADLSGDFDVNDQGAVALPLVGQVDAVGKTVAEFQAEIAQKYGATYLVNPRVSVAVLNYRPFFILGEVKTPASYPYVNGMTVINAIALAGGYTPRANKQNIVIKRANDPSATEQTVNEDAPVLPGDVIRVPERFF